VRRAAGHARRARDLLANVRSVRLDCDEAPQGLAFMEDAAVERARRDRLVDRVDDTRDLAECSADVALANRRGECGAQ
jgi:hypothetical protein